MEKQVISAVILMVIFSSCSTNPSNISYKKSCDPGRTLINSVCVSYDVADYILCVRARGASIENYHRSEVGFEVKYLASASTRFEASKKLAEKYPDSSENIKAIIEGCSLIAGVRQLKQPIDTPDTPDTPEKAKVITVSKPKIRLSSTFNNRSKDGWSITGSEMKNPGAGGSGGGPNNGAIVVTKDIGGKIGYFVSPGKYRGNWTSYSKIHFDIWSKGGEYFTEHKGVEYGDVIIYSGFSKAQRFLPQRPEKIWRSFIIPLEDDGSWTFEGGIDNLTDILSNVTGFKIRAEYGIGSDVSALDNVYLE